MSADDRETRHRARMERKKKVVDAAIIRADRDQGLLLVLTGNGKGKSSSAFGMLARASPGHPRSWFYAGDADSCRAGKCELV